ncbi:glycosyltransferase family 2 protein [Leptolyngbya sp. FACHB-36]|uniref:glycosyltransferase family 2 protein n=1 Tax=Leptolyngbya sp. FACHB-36 TaxID=2692808 RepID=UPI0016810109|nr:glycosyltransferase family A protein [Leptolyngbya sp. FACHB-36]MBD2022176.1 glycosyltransferase family 2 protein [Leptolyngbya sp. FACHB-36]
MMNSKPPVSVLLPAYNSQRYVAETVESILAQTMSDFELIIIDDGSTDDTLKILQQYAAKDSRIRLSSHENQGVSRTRNQLLAQAQGEIIAVMDADDVALPDRFARQLEFLQTHPEVVCVGAAHEVIDEEGRLLTCLILPEDDAEIQRQALAGHGSICHPCAMIRRSALLQVGGYDERLLSAHDLDLWLKLGEVGQLANLKDVLMRYRINTQSVSAKNPKEQRDEARMACEWAWQRRNIEGRFEAAEPWRPSDDRASRHQFTLQYAWWAFYSHRRGTALHYILRAIRLKPFAIENWQLLLCNTFNIEPSS